ncbi:MAG: hypothetical protein WC714_28515 [Candidatus Obscuribacterales bacterium]
MKQRIEDHERHWHECNDWEQREEVAAGCVIGCLILAVLAIIFN